MTDHTVAERVVDEWDGGSYSLVPLIAAALAEARREGKRAGMVKAAEICEHEEGEFDVALAVTKQKGDACRKLAAEFRRRSRAHDAD